MLSQDRLKGNWNQVAGAVKERFGSVTNDDLTRVRGNVDQLVGMLQEKTGRSREQINEFLNNCCGSAGETMDRIRDGASQYAEAAGQAVRENYDRAVGSAQQGYQQTVRQIAKRPVESLALAVGAGLLAGLIAGLALRSGKR